jgi:hypothetical protein
LEHRRCRVCQTQIGSSGGTGATLVVYLEDAEASPVYACSVEHAIVALARAFDMDEALHDLLFAGAAFCGQPPDDPGETEPLAFTGPAGLLCPECYDMLTAAGRIPPGEMVFRVNAQDIALLDRYPRCGSCATALSQK